MRLLIRLKSLKDCAYEMKYHAKMQGFFYNLLRDAGIDSLHDKIGYKFFCFSNIYPIAAMSAGDSRNLLFSSPDKRIVKAVQAEIEKLKEKGAPANIGDMSFAVTGTSVIKPKLSGGATIIAATPITIRIPERNYDVYGIPPAERKKNYVYWRPSIDFSAFVKQLNENLFKKYNEYYGAKIEEFPVFEQYRYKKPAVSYIIEDGGEYQVAGSIWEFSFPYMSEEQKKLLEFGIECGFGERNSLGFGFVNIVKSIGNA